MSTFAPFVALGLGTTSLKVSHYISIVCNKCDQYEIKSLVQGAGDLALVYYRRDLYIEPPERMPY